MLEQIKVEQEKLLRPIRRSEKILCKEVSDENESSYNVMVFGYP